MLSIVQVKLETPIILLERFIHGGGWIEIFLIAAYGALVIYFMQDPGKVQKWRLRTWSIFSIVFFGQLALGLLGYEKFLMTGKLHLPIPVMILSGPIYRAQVSVMPLLFLSTVILTGPAWCSQLCYFGALDGLAARRKISGKPLKNKFLWKHSLIILIIFFTLLLRLFQVPGLYTTIIALVFGVTGLGLIVFVSLRKGKMIHCIYYCPIGTVVNYFRYINPFRMSIDQSCTSCMKCSPVCKYDALTVRDIENRKPGKTCTYCGDCLVSCKTSSIRYRFLNLTPAAARNLYLVLTVSLHAIFLALGRI